MATSIFLNILPLLTNNKTDDLNKPLTYNFDEFTNLHSGERLTPSTQKNYILGEKLKFYLDKQGQLTQASKSESPRITRLDMFSSPLIYHLPTVINSIQIQLVAQAVTTEPITYYISPTGSDQNTGTSSTSAWSSLSKINSLDLNPGDQVLLEGGYTYQGNLNFTQEDAGTSTAPITISSYGTGTATIDAGTGSGMFIYNTAGYNISNLKLVGSGASTNTSDGIMFYNDLANDVKLDGITITNLEVSKFKKYGLVIGSWNNQSGYQNVTVNNVVSHDNGGGIITYAQVPNVHQNINLSYIRAYNNQGNGVTLSGVNGGGVERSVTNNNIGPGIIGVWTYDSTGITLQYNESYNNRTTGGSDGGGFDFDQNVSNSIMQYNYSHGNDGSGFLLCHQLDNQSFTDNIVRYNISENDGRKNSFAGIDVYGRVLNTQIYNNTVFMKAATTGRPSAIRIWNTAKENLKVGGMKIYNNIFQTQNGVNLVNVSSSQVNGSTDFLFQGNNYYSTGGVAESTNEG